MSDNNGFKEQPHHRVTMHRLLSQLESEEPGKTRPWLTWIMAVILGMALAGAMLYYFIFVV